MNRDDPIIQAWVDATNCYLAGKGLPPLKLSHDEQEAVASVAFPEWNAGARMADDLFCACGARGYVLCPACQSEENRAGR